MKTEKEWLEIYHKVWDLFKQERHNYVRLKIGQFKDNNTWACIEVLIPHIDKGFLKDIINISDKYNLRMDFQGEYEFKLWEDYEKNEDASSTKKGCGKKIDCMNCPNWICGEDGLLCDDCKSTLKVGDNCPRCGAIGLCARSLRHHQLGRCEKLTKELPEYEVGKYCFVLKNPPKRENPISTKRVINSPLKIGEMQKDIHSQDKELMDKDYGKSDKQKWNEYKEKRDAYDKNNAQEQHGNN